MFAVVMAGGAGTRFWPASRKNLPKQFLRITSSKTMIEETVERIGNLTDRICIVTNHAQKGKVEELFGEKFWILAEPFGRNTSACIGLAAMQICYFYGNTPIACLPADHFIADSERFREKLKKALELAKQGCIVTLGILPTRPETGYGYIEKGDLVSTEEKVYKAKRFIEKPEAKTAVEFVSSGNYLWNSGIFVFTTDTILAEIKLFMPELYSGLEEVKRSIGTNEYESVLEKIYSGLPSISIDYGIMEKTKRQIYVLESDFGWSDVGSWFSLYELRNDKDDSDNLLIADALSINSKKNLVYSDSKRLVCLLGVEGLAIVDTLDVLLVMKLEHSQEVRKFPELLEKSGKSNLC